MNKYLKFAIRLVEAFMIFIITISLVFILLYSVPGRVGTAQDIHQTGAGLDAVNAKAGITGNFFTDYGQFLKHSLTFDFDRSIAMHPGQKINSFLWKKMGISFTISGIAVIISLMLCIPLAIWFARKPGKMVDGVGMFFVSIFIAVPGFIVGVVLMILGSKIGLPIAFEISDISTWIMPIISLTLAPTAYKIVMMRTGLIETRNQQFVKFARAKGATNKKVEYRHILRISLFPIITYLPASFLGAFLGSMLVENIFGIPGAGSLLSSAIQSKDYPIVQAVITMSVLMVIVSYILRDITYRIIDPRVKG